MPAWGINGAGVSFSSLARSRVKSEFSSDRMHSRVQTTTTNSQIDDGSMMDVLKKSGLLLSEEGIVGSIKVPR